MQYRSRGLGPGFEILAHLRKTSNLTIVYHFFGIILKIWKKASYFSIRFSDAADIMKETCNKAISLDIQQTVHKNTNYFLFVRTHVVAKVLHLNTEYRVPL